MYFSVPLDIVFAVVGLPQQSSQIPILANHRAIVFDQDAVLSFRHFVFSFLISLSGQDSSKTGYTEVDPVKTPRVFRHVSSDLSGTDT